MAYHSKYNNSQIEKTACGICIAPLKTNILGPAKTFSGDEDDIIDEAIKYFRPNIFFKNFDITGPGDLTLIYLTVFISYCLKTIANENNELDAKKKLLDLSREAIPKAGEKNFFMGRLLKDPKDIGEADLFASYLKQCKEELVLRLLKILYKNGTKAIDFKYWIGLSKRKFMGLSFIAL